MKKFVIAFCILVYSFGNSQEKKTIDFKQNELKLDVTYLIFAGALNASYEHLVNDESGLGVGLVLSSGREINTIFSLSPYYRFYFGDKPAAGFFFEGFTMLSSFKAEKRTPYGYYYSYETSNVTDFAIGIGIGGKWITRNGILFEINSGVGRNLLNDYSNYASSYKIVGKFGLSVGYRF